MESTTQQLIELRKLVENLPMMVFLATRREDGVVIFSRVEGQLMNALGVSENKLMEKPVSGVFAGKISEDLLQSVFKFKRKTEEIYFQEHWLEVELIPFDDFGEVTDIVGVVKDISERRIAQDYLKKLALALDYITDAVVILDPEGAILHINPAFTELYGYQARDILGEGLRKLHADLNPEPLIQELQADLEQNEWSGELTHRRASGEEFPVYLKGAAVFSEKNQRIASVAILRDNTQLKQTLHRKQAAERDRRQMTANLYSYAKLLNEELAPYQTTFNKNFPNAFLIENNASRLQSHALWTSSQFDTYFVALLETRQSGVMASLTLFTAISLLNQIVNDELESDPNRIMVELDQKLNPFQVLNEGQEEANRGLRMAFLVYSPKKDLARFAGAGLNAYWIQPHQCQLLQGVKLPLGVSLKNEKERFFQPETLSLAEGHKIVLATSELFQLHNPDKDQLLSEERLQSLLENLHDQEIERFELLLRQFLQAWIGGKEPRSNYLLAGLGHEA